MIDCKKRKECVGLAQRIELINEGREGGKNERKDKTECLMLQWNQHDRILEELVVDCIYT